MPSPLHALPKPGALPWRRFFSTAAVTLCVASTQPALAVQVPGPSDRRAQTSVQPSTDVQTMHRWIRQSGDNASGPFMVLDKRQARLWVFDRHGRRVAHSPVLLGAAPGDDSVPGIGERPMSQIQPHERTTPAGRYWVEPGVNAKGEDIFWVDYDVAVSLHRVRAHRTAERRLERLATPTPEDNRISYGCINVPVDFYEATVKPLFTRTKGWIYVLPETQPVQTLFKPASIATPAG
jgi:hypothetical protein